MSFSYKSHDTEVSQTPASRCPYHGRNSPQLSGDNETNSFGRSSKKLFDRLIEFTDKLEAKGCIVKGKLRTVKHMLKMLLCNWYHDMIDYVKAIFDFCPKQIQFSGSQKKVLT